jgi:hypothetical protein
MPYLLTVMANNLSGEVCKSSGTSCGAGDAGLNHKQCQIPVDARDNQGECEQIVRGSPRKGSLEVEVDEW